MGTVVLFGSQKGGTGKTTASTNTAAYLVLNGFDCILVDADQQQSASTWAQDRQENQQVTQKVTRVSLSGSIRADLLDLKKRYQFVIVDCAGRDSRELRTGMTAADILFSPLRPSQYDLDTLPKLIEVYEQAKDYNDSLRGYVVINQAPTNPFIKEAEQAKSYIADYPELKIAKQVIHDRKAFRDTASEGLSIFESSNKKAIEEFKSVIEEIILNG